jgi:hypothetical protein
MRSANLLDALYAEQAAPPLAGKTMTSAMRASPARTAPTWLNFPKGSTSMT